MKQVLCGVLLSVALSNSIFGQLNEEVLIKEAAERLENNKASISQVLTDKKYDAVHAITTFRDLIKKYSNTGTISIAADTIPGKKIQVIGIIKSAEGRPVANALVYLYQTDSRGWYAADAPHVLMNEGDMRHARLFGYVRTNEKGMFEMHTIKPSGYPKSDLPAHIHVHIEAAGYQPLVTEFIFDDDERLVGEIRENALRNRFIVSKPAGADAHFQQKFSYSLALEKR